MNLPGLLLLGLLLLFCAPGHAGMIFNVAIIEDGNYRLAYEELGQLKNPVASETLRLYEQGKAVPIQVDDGGDGFFGPGDSIGFVGRHLEGSNSWYNEYSRHNIYRLYMGALPQDTPNPMALARGPIIEHLEQDILRVALPHASETKPTEHWYWQRITHLSGDGFSREMQWANRPRAIRVALSGLSRDKNAANAGLAQHRVVIRLDGQVIGESAWNGQEPVTLEITDLHGLAPAPGNALLEVVIPGRTVPGSGQEIIDVVLLNWIEVEYPSDPSLVARTIPDRSGAHRLLVDAGGQSPAWVAPSKTGAGLSARDRQADYLMISHPSLLQALEPLAAYHRNQGLKVAVIDVQDIYEAFNHGIESPLAIRKFISYAWHQWRRPAPRLVLLAGDASWERDPGSTVNRNLVPTLHVQSRGALAASDNGLVTVAGNDWRPDLAIGRLPAGSEEELSGMIAKLLHYAEDSPAGKWRNRATWVSDIDPGFQRISNDLADGLANRGFTNKRIYPDESAQHSSQDQLRVIEAFDQGSALLHFLGHGGRLVWRTGPRDLSGASDLFGLKDIESLRESRSLPLVLSMTCSSGPFDHPTADSIAEALLRTPDRGAIGVLAASSRVQASRRFSSLLVNALLENGSRIGEAVMQAKRKETDRTLVESYNLLGDPALFLISAERP
jgi:hypothetical protein